MIGVIDVVIQAANPSMPLFPMRAYVNSPSSIRLRNVPRKIGDWNIERVYFTAAYPDGSIKTANCVLVGGVWVGTIEGSTISGKSENGFTVYADGKDEHGLPVTGYVLGKGLIEILDADGTITPGETTYYVHLLDAQPTSPKEGDMWKDSSGVWYIYQDGTAKRLDAEAARLANAAFVIGDNAYSRASSAIDATTAISAKIPAQASAQNQLADKAFVNSSVQTATANFRGNWTTWADVPTVSSDYPADYAGSKVPTVNDYLVVQDASGYDIDELSGTWRFKYSGTWATDGKIGWLPEYQVNETPMTAAQLAAINSNITAAKVAQYDEAMTKFNYELVDVPQTIEPFVLSSMFPIVFTESWGDAPTTITSADAGNMSFNLNSQDDWNVRYNGQHVFYASLSGKYAFSDTGHEITFNGAEPQENVTQVLGFNSFYQVHDRAINTLSVDSSTSVHDLAFPSSIVNHARDFMVRIVASAGTYATPPTLSVSGVTLMNADGEMPEIKTDTTNACTTLIYFSEISPNVFLVKGEQLEAITL